MKRGIFKTLLRMHPSSFRRRFGAEMLWIFDESAGPAALLVDGLVSLLRQWWARLGMWKVALAILGAGFQVIAGGLIWLLLINGSKPVGSGPLQNEIELRGLMQLILWGAGSTIVMVMITALWLRRFTARRGHVR